MAYSHRNIHLTICSQYCLSSREAPLERAWDWTELRWIKQVYMHGEWCFHTHCRVGALSSAGSRLCASLFPLQWECHYVIQCNYNELTVRKGKERNGKYNLFSFQYNISVIFQIVSTAPGLFSHFSKFPIHAGESALRTQLEQPNCAQILIPVTVNRRCQRELAATPIPTSNIPVPQRWLGLVITPKKDVFLVSLDMVQKNLSYFQSFNSCAFCIQKYVAASKGDTLVKSIIYCY